MVAGISAGTGRGNAGSLHTEHVRRGLLSGFSISVYPRSTNAVEVERH